MLDRDDLELYGARIAVDFVARLRGSQIRFDTIDDLLVQMKADVDGARAPAEPCVPAGRRIRVDASTD